MTACESFSPDGGWKPEPDMMETRFDHSTVSYYDSFIMTHYLLRQLPKPECIFLDLELDKESKEKVGKRNIQLSSFQLLHLVAQLEEVSIPSGRYDSTFMTHII